MEDKEVYIYSVEFNSCIKKTRNVVGCLADSNKFEKPVLEKLNSGPIEVQSDAINEFKEILNLAVKNIQIYREIALKTLNNADKAMEHLKNTDADISMKMDAMFLRNVQQNNVNKNGKSYIDNKINTDMFYPDRKGDVNGSSTIPGGDNGKPGLNNSSSNGGMSHSIFDFENTTGGSM